MGLMDKIELIVFINLEKRKDRLESISKELGTFFVNSKIRRFNGIVHTNGHVGCGLSHIQILDFAKKNNLQNILIVEDDFYFKIDKFELNRKLKHLFEHYPNFDICLFGVNLLKSKRLDEHIHQVEDGQTTSCYLVQNHFFEKLRDAFQKGVNGLLAGGKNDEFAIDQSWKPLQKEGFLAFEPKIGGQKNGWSDTERRFAFYNC